MKTRTWIIVLGTLALAGLADAWTWALAPEFLRATDLSPIARLFAGYPSGFLLSKVATVALIAGIVWLARGVSPRFEHSALLVVLVGVVYWTIGSGINLATVLAA